MMKSTTLIVALIWVVVTTPGCSSDPSGPPVLGKQSTGPPSELSWQWFNPWPQGNDLHGVWVTEAGEVFAVGDVGTVLQSNGADWTLHKTGSNDRLTSVWASSRSNVIVTTWSGVLLEYDGAKWRAKPTSSARLNDVLGIDASVYAVGHGGVVLKKAGGTWTEITTPFSNEITNLWGNAPDDLFVVGETGLIAHYDGEGWQGMNSGTSEYLDGIWGFGPTDVYATGNGPTTLHYDGNTWEHVAVPVSGDIRNIWGRDSNSIFLVTRDGEIAQYNGTNWSIIDSSQPFLWSIRGNSQFAFAVGAKGRLLKYQNQSWERLDRGPVAHVNDLWAFSDEEILAVTDDGDVWRFNGDDNHTSTNLGETCQLKGIWGSDTANIYAVGRRAPGGRWVGVIFKFDGSAWTQVYTSWLGFNSVWGSSANDVYAVGNHGEVVHYNGVVWEVVFATSGFGYLYDVWGSGADDVFAVGGEITLDPDRRGWIRHYNDGEWSVQRIGEVDSFRGVWGRSPEDVYAVGDWSAYHYDGANWERVDVPWQRQLFSVSGFIDGNVFFGSLGGRIFSYDGATVSEMATGTGTVFYSILATSSGVAWAAGGNGTILRHLR